MKKGWIAAMLAGMLLCGCAETAVFEPVQDVYQVMAPDAAQIWAQLPDDAAVTAMGDAQTGTIYFCDGYTVTVQTLAGGDLDRTLRTMTGYGAEDLLVLETAGEAGKRYECVWISAGEAGDQVGRLVLLDDGAYHYVVTVMADAGLAGSLRDAWDEILGSVSLGDTET